MTLLTAGSILEGGINDVERAYAETKIIPTVKLSEFYDSNVFIAPKGFHTGRIPWDAGTTLSSDVQVTHKTRDIDAAIDGQVAGTTYANNPDLSYISTSALLNANLDGWIGRMVSGAKLQIQDSFLYTPELPAFLPGGRAATQSDFFGRGIQASRATTFTNTASVTGAYAFTPLIGLRGTYSYALFKVGQIFITGPNEFTVPFFDTNIHSFSGGPTLQLTRSETVSLNYQNTFMHFSGAGIQQSFEAHGGAIEYSKVTPDWTATMSGGATLITQGQQAFFSGRATLMGKVDPLTQVTLVASRAVGAAFIATGGAMISTTATVYLSRQLTRLLNLTASLNYALNESTPTRVVEFETYTASVNLKYEFTRSVFAELNYNYADFRGGGEQLAVPLLIERNLAMLSITKRWD